MSNSNRIQIGSKARSLFGKPFFLPKEIQFKSLAPTANSTLLFVILCSFVAIPTSCRIPSADWNGTYELDRSKSTFQGPVFTLSISPDGTYRYDDGYSSSTMLCDGKERPTGEGTTKICTIRGTSAIDVVDKNADGSERGRSHLQISPDGKIFTSTHTRYRAIGPELTNESSATRTTGSEGFNGKWRSESYLNEHGQLSLKLNNNVLYVAYPNAKQFVEASLDGAESPVRGDGAPKGTTYSVRIVGPRTFSVTTKRTGTILTQGTLELGDDGRTIVESWNGARRLVYVKR